MTDLLHDLRFGARMLRKRLGTAALAVVALALGIGLTTTMFSIVQGVFLRGLPFPESERIVHVGRVTSGQQNVQSAPLHDFVDWRDSQQSFESLAAFSNSNATVSDGIAPQRYRRSRITTNTLRVLRVAPIIGRDFTEVDGEPGAPPVVIIGDAIWASQFQRDPSVINRAVRVNGEPATIIGVMPPRFGFPQSQEMWTPLAITLPEKRGQGMYVEVFGRLKDGTPIERATAEFDTIARRLRDAYPENKDINTRVSPFLERFIGADVRSTLYAMLAAVFGVMLIACANVANLQLARAAERTREVALRMALGASRGRIVRQMLLEGLMLSTVGAALGLIIAAVGTTLFSNNIGDTSPPFWIDVRLDATVLAFATALTVVSALAASLIPALRATRQDLNSVLKDEGRGSTSLYMGRFSRWLVVAEVLLSCCLLVVSGLMIKGVVAVGRIPYPYATADVFYSGISASETRYTDPAARVRVLQRIEDELSTAPGVRALALASGTPENSGTTSVAVEGATYATPREQPSARRIAISPRYFEVLRVDVLAGRAFSPQDAIGVEPVVIVGQDFAQKLFPGANVLGSRIRLGDANAPWLTIVGIVPKLSTSRTQGTSEHVYVPLAQSPQLSLSVLAWASGNPVALTPALRAAAVKVDEDIALSNPNALATEYWRQSWHFRVFGTLFMSFGVAALILASAGLYGVMAFSVRRRTGEIGVRMALGANRSRIVRLILYQGLSRCVLGIVLGLGPAWLLGGAMKELLFNVTPGDPFVVTTTVVGLLTAGFLASVVPALRAASVDPLVALRRD